MPAKRLLYALGLSGLLIVVGALEPRALSAGLLLDALLLAAFVFDLVRARRVTLQAARDWPEVLAQSTKAMVTTRVRLAAAARTRAAHRVTIVLREGLDPKLVAAPQSHDLELAPNEEARWSFEIQPRGRGEVRVAPLTARVLGPWKLAWSQRDLLPGEPRRIYPRVRWEGKVGHLLALAQRHQLGANPLRIQGVGREPYALREYLPGDAIGRIHWKATARHGRPIVREETWERGARLLILLDCARTMTSREGDLSKLDHALAATLALARVASGRGDRVTVLAFSHRVERTVRMAASGKGLAQAYAALYDLEASLNEPAYDLAAHEALRLEHRSATVVLFTSVVDLAAAELLKSALLALERRHRVLLVNLEDPELVRLVETPPRTPPQAFAHVAALEIAVANRHLATTLRRAGIRAVTTAADRLALEAIESYLEMFRGGGQRRDQGRSRRSVPAR